MEASFSSIIHNWFYNKHLIQVSMVVGSDLKPRLQICKNLTKTQFELFDRPDGIRPNQSDTYLRFVQNIYQQKRKQREVFTLTSRHCIQLEKEATLFLTRAMAYLHIQQTKLAEKDLLFVLSVLGFVIKKSKKPEIVKYFKRYFDVTVMLYQKVQSLLSSQLGDTERAELFDKMAAGSLKRLFEMANRETLYFEDADLRSLNYFIRGDQEKPGNTIAHSETEFFMIQPDENASENDRAFTQDLVKEIVA